MTKQTYIKTGESTWTPVSNVWLKTGESTWTDQIVPYRKTTDSSWNACMDYDYDDFDSYNEGSLDGQGHWVENRGDFYVVDFSGDKGVRSNQGSAENSISYQAKSYSANQFSEITYKVDENDVYIGPAVRVGNNGHCCFYEAWTGAYFIIVIGGSTVVEYQFTGMNPSTGDKLRLDASGNTFYCYHNGGLIYQHTNNDLSTGYPGLGGYSVGGAYASDFRCGNLT